jgi:Ca2+-transporting ATPase
MVNWHEQDALSGVQSLGSDVATGLSESEAVRRFEQFGTNELTQYIAKSAGQILWEGLAALMMIILICATIISALLADYKDSIAIGAIVL